MKQPRLSEPPPRPRWLFLIADVLTTPLAYLVFVLPEDIKRWRERGQVRCGVAVRK